MVYLTNCKNSMNAEKQRECLKFLLENVLKENDLTCNNFRITLEELKDVTTDFPLLSSTLLYVSTIIKIDYYKAPISLENGEPVLMYNSSPIFSWFRFDGTFNYGFDKEFFKKIRLNDIESLLNEIYPAKFKNQHN